MRKYLQTNENGNRTIQILWDATKVVLRGEFMMIQAYSKKNEKAQRKQGYLSSKGIRKRRPTLATGDRHQK